MPKHSDDHDLENPGILAILATWAALALVWCGIVGALVGVIVLVSYAF